MAPSTHYTRVGGYWKRFGETPRRWGFRAVHTALGQYTSTLVEYTPPEEGRTHATVKRAPPGVRRGTTDVQIGDKSPDRSHADEAKPHDSKVLVHAIWGSNIPLSPMWTPTGQFPEESSAAPSVNTVVSAPILIFRKYSYPTPSTRSTKIIDSLDKNLRLFRMNIMTAFNVVD